MARSQRPPAQQRLPAPSEFMRGRRPELFSDSTERSELVLEPSRLEYHLDSMTARSEEKQFEHYCRQLCAREICPSLRPQTGPTGGGDSKVDSDSLPVAKAISDQWYVGDAEELGAADLAFAFSAMKDFARKVRSDVKSIASTGRPYKRIYFVTNQFISDKRKGQLEDELRKKYRVPVSILDRTWLVDKTINRKNIDIAVSALGMGDLEREHRKSTGVHDFAREKRLRELEERLADRSNYAGSYQMVEDAIEAALVDRGMGSPEGEVRGRFERAIRLAKEHGGRLQLLRAMYLWIWTAYWWFDDAATLRAGYLDLEGEFLSDASVWEVEYLVNLEIAIGGSAALDEFVPGAAHEGARARVQEALARMTLQKGAPTQALWARTLLLFLRMKEELHLGSPEKSVGELREVLDQAKFLPEFPLNGLLNWIVVLLEIAPEDERLLDLADEVASTRSTRASVSAQVGVRVQIATGHLARDAPYPALEQLGLAQVALQEHLSIKEQAWLWTLCATAYERAGLYWAQRSCLVCAIATGFGVFRRKGEIPAHLVSRVRRLIWAELQLGNLPSALKWFEVWELLRANAADDLTEEEVREQRMTMNVAIGLAALRTCDHDLKRLDSLPEVLRAIDLWSAADFTLIALGHEDTLAAEVGDTVEGVRQTAALLMAQPIASQLPQRSNWRLDPAVELSTIVLGCRVHIVTDGRRDSVLFAEGFLGFFEAMLALGIERHVYAERDEVMVNIKRGEGAAALSWVVAADDCGEQQFAVHLGGPAIDDGVLNPNRWGHLAVELALHVVRFPDDRVAEKLLAPGSGSADRALSLVGVPRMLENVLGRQFPHGPAWIAEAKAQHAQEAPDWPLTRTAPLEAVLPAVKVQAAIDEEARGYFAHDVMRSSGLVNMNVWPESKWRGFSYAIPPGEEPVLGILFENHAAARQIFRGWRKRLGDVDTDEQLVLGAITGIERDNPARYRAVLTHSMKAGQFRTLPCLRMTLTRGEGGCSLEEFLRRLREFGSYIVVPVLIDYARMRNGPPESWWDMLDLELAIRKRKFHISAAWQVGHGHDLMMGFMTGDLPHVPDGVENPPCSEIISLISSGRSEIPRPTRK